MSQHVTGHHTYQGLCTTNCSHQYHDQSQSHYEYHAPPTVSLRVRTRISIVTAAGFTLIIRSGSNFHSSKLRFTINTSMAARDSRCRRQHRAYLWISRAFRRCLQQGAFAQFCKSIIPLVINFQVKKNRIKQINWNTHGWRQAGVPFTFSISSSHCQPMSFYWKWWGS